MTTVAAPQPREESGDRVEVIDPSAQSGALRSSRRDELEALGFLLGLTGVLLGLVLTLGAPIPIGQ
jgi:hypothetical protein